LTGLEVILGRYRTFCSRESGRKDSFLHHPGYFPRTPLGFGCFHFTASKTLAAITGIKVGNPRHPTFRIVLTEVFFQRTGFQEDEMIKKVSGGYKVLSEKGKNLGGPYKTKEQAEKRLRQVEYFKHKK